MSIVVETFLMCDNCQRNFGVDNRNYSGKQQRESAKQNGWKFSKGKDLCPDCIANPENKKLPNNRDWSYS